MPQTLKIAFLGDIGLNGKYIKLYQEGIDPFAAITGLKDRDGHIIGNLECMAKGDQGENLLKKPRITTTVDTLGFLKKIGVTAVSLAQNHIYDHLEDGFEKTVHFLDQHGISRLGAGWNKDEAGRPLIIQENGIKVGMINYVTEDTNPALPADAKVCLNFFNEEKALQDIALLRPRVDHLVLLLHWGGRVEGGMFPDYDQPFIAHRLIDAGADLIIGHHAHTFQPYEKYKGKYIFYSLGNFCFSDFEFEGRQIYLPKRRKITGLVDITFSKTDYKIKLNFYYNVLTHFKSLPNYHFKVKLRNIVFKYFFKYFFIWRIYFFFKSNMLPVYLFFIRPDIPFRHKLSRIIKSFLRRLS